MAFRHGCVATYGGHIMAVVITQVKLFIRDIFIQNHNVLSCRNEYYIKYIIKIEKKTQTDIIMDDSHYMVECLKSVLNANSAPCNKCLNIITFWLRNDILGP